MSKTMLRTLVVIMFFFLVATGKGIAVKAYSGSNWVGELYSNQEFKGTPITIGTDDSIKELQYNWGNGSPHPSIGNDNFSARFTKTATFEKGIYYFNVNADDGVRIYLDNSLIIDSWGSSWGEDRTYTVNVTGGKHTLKVEYREITGEAKLNFSYKKLTEVPSEKKSTIRKNFGYNGVSGYPNDYFTTTYDQSGTYNSGDYFIQTLADDGVRVDVDGNKLINRWYPAYLAVNRAFWFDVKEGYHSIKTDFFELDGEAFIFSDIVPFDSWLAYYYPNDSIGGKPAFGKVLKPQGEYGTLRDDHAYGSPDSSIPADNFSARYITAKHLKAGDYILRTTADDGVRVYVDGVKVIDRWDAGNNLENTVKLNIKDNVNGQSSNEKDTHWIEVEYLEKSGKANVDFSIVPFEDESTDSWLGEVFSNKDLKGTPVVIGGKSSKEKINAINFDWGENAPVSGVPSDNFSTRFTKEVKLDGGEYYFKTNSDDGVRVYLDDKLVIDSWGSSWGEDRTNTVSIASGTHTFKVEHYDGTGNAKLNFEYKKLTTAPTQTTKQVKYNWGTSGPNGLKDYFHTVFDQTQNLSAGDYFLQTLADDGVKVEVDGKFHINQWYPSYLGVSRAFLPNIANGSHSIKTHYFELDGEAAVYSNIVPFNSWLAYYYPNKDLSGKPANTEIIAPTGELDKLQVNYGSGKPNGISNSDQFSARYITAKRVKAGDYVLRVKADDGARVYVDGNKVLDTWNAGDSNEYAVKVNIKDTKENQDMHWIEVEYTENTGLASIEVFMEEYQKSKEINSWYGEIYPNKNLSGNPYIIGGKNSSNTIQKLDFNWYELSPNRLIPNDQYSAVFTKNETLEAGTYQFEAKADDGIRVFVDNKKVIDSWGPSWGETSKNAVYLEKGTHNFRVEYYEDTGNAQLYFDYKKISSKPLLYQIGGDVHYNWGEGRPNATLPADNFEAIFDQSGTYEQGDYFLQTYADDGIRVKVNGNLLVDNWVNSSGVINRSLYTGHKGGYLPITTEYYENTGLATVFSDFVLFGNWLAYYYPNVELSGNPVAAKVIPAHNNGKSFVENSGEGSPAANVPNDNFSARYSTVKRIPAGDYIIRTKSDDGVKVFIDGNLVLDRWNDGYREDSVQVSIKDKPNSNDANAHTIEVQYRDVGSSSNIDFSILPKEEVSATESWVGYVYPNKNLEGNPVVIGGAGAEQIYEKLDINWGEGSPSPMIPNDNFSAKFYKRANFEEGIYQFSLNGDDGFKLYVDGDLKINSWKEGPNTANASVYIPAGQHEILVEYYEGVSSSRIKLDYQKLDVNSKFVSSIKLPAYRTLEELQDYRKHLTIYNPSYTRYFELGYGDIVKVLDIKSYAANILTMDGRTAWVHTEYLEDSLVEDKWLLKEARALRSSASNSSSKIGDIRAGEMVHILDHVSTNDAYSEWYNIKTESGQTGWIWGAITTSGNNSGYNLIKYESNKVGTVTNDVNIFTPLNTKADVTADQINRFIDYKTGGKNTLMTGKGDVYLLAQEQSGLNALYLMAHSGLETGWGTSKIVSSKYNFYGIGAIDSQPAEGAYDYTTPEGGIIAGASWISKNYVIRAWDTDNVLPYYQPTLDNMKYDNSWHQYATDEAWAVKISYFIQEFNQFIKN